MPFCEGTTTVRHDPGGRHTVRPLKCRSWACDTCQPDRRRRLVAEACGGAPDKLVTLTARPHDGESPSEMLDRLLRGLKCLVKALRRRHGPDKIAYLYVVERHRSGWPHLHVLLRSPWIDQRWLSAVMEQLADGPVVDIRKIDNAGRVGAYVAKYVGKAPAQVGNHKRYAKTRNYETRPEWREKPRRDWRVVYRWWDEQWRRVVDLIAVPGYHTVEWHDCFAIVHPPPAAARPPPKAASA